MSGTRCDIIFGIPWTDELEEALRDAGIDFESPEDVGFTNLYTSWSPPPFAAYIGIKLTSINDGMAPHKFNDLIRVVGDKYFDGDHAEWKKLIEGLEPAVRNVLRDFDTDIWMIWSST